MGRSFRNGAAAAWLLLAAGGAGAQVTVINGASFQPGPVARLSLVSAFGVFPGVSQEQAGRLPLPESLGGVRVLVGGVPARLQYVSSGQINFMVPQGVTGRTATVRVEREGSTVAEGTLALAAAAPGLFVGDFSDAGLPGAVLNQDSQPNGPTQPARRGEVIQIFGTGQGVELTAPVEDGAASPREVRTRLVPEVYVGAVRAAVAFSGLSPQFPGVWQINAVVPAGVAASGRAPLFVTLGGASSNAVSIWIAP